MTIHSDITDRVLTLVVLCALATSGSLQAQAGRVERSKRGDTVVVRTTGNGTWGAPHAAVEVLRVGGGSAETTFGQVRALTVLNNGTIALFDAKSSDGPIIRLLDANGKFLRNVSRTGAGPGEYKGNFPWPNAMPDGRLMISDPENNRASFYTAEGKYLSMISYNKGGFASVDMIRPAPHGGVYVMATFRGIRESNHGFRQLDSTGKVIDSLMPPTATGGFAAGYTTRVLLDGSMILTAPDRVAFLVQPSAKSAPRVLAELNVPRVRYLPKEREEMLTEMRKEVAHEEDGSRHVPTLPEFKEVWRDQFVGGADRIWLRRNVTAVPGPLKTEPDGFQHTMRFLVVYDAFQPDGTFLGEVSFPDEFRALAFVGDFAWGVVSGRDDEVYLVKYRVR